MATLDETNIFGLTPEQPEKKDDSLSRLGISESGYLNRLAQIQNMQEVATEVKAKLAEPSYGLGYPGISKVHGKRRLNRAIFC